MEDNGTLVSFVHKGTRDWQSEGACKGVEPDLFFTERGVSNQTAKAMCGLCVIKVECLDYAVTNNEAYGVWGGKSERERRKIRRQQNVAKRTNSILNQSIAINTVSSDE